MTINENNIISVIIPVYNVEQYLNRCLESVCNQTYYNLEIILIDDGSTDESGKMCDKWAEKDSRIKVIHKENGGLSSARNAGLDVANGEYIGFVDSDDWISSSMYEMLYNLINKNEEYDISVCAFRKTWDDKNQLLENITCSTVKIWSRNDFLKRLLKINCQDSNQYAWNKLYRKKIMQNVRYPQGLIDEDVEGTFIAVLNVKKIIETSQVGYFYFQHPKSITQRAFSIHSFEYLTICDHIVQITEETENSELINYAKQFRKRANLGVLCRMLIAPKENIEPYADREKKLVQTVKKQWFDLMKCPMPISRKVLVLGIKINYTCVKYTIRILKMQKRYDRDLIRNCKGKK